MSTSPKLPANASAAGVPSSGGINASSMSESRAPPPEANEQALSSKVLSEVMRGFNGGSPSSFSVSE